MKTNEARDAAICAYYLDGHKLSECASFFKLGRQRVQQILQKADVWRPYVKTGRNEFLGVSISEKAKLALKTEADRRGVSMSRLTNDVIEDLLKPAE